MKYDTNKGVKSAKPNNIMGKVKITHNGFSCERCEHKWIPRKKTRPRVCPKCKSAYWDVPKKKKTHRS